MDERPRLLSAPPSTSVTLVLNNLLNIASLTSEEDFFGFDKARWGAHMVLANSENGTGVLIHETDRSLDDEFAPGVFMLDQITTPCCRSSSEPEGGYVQWRPVCYLTSQRDITKATLPSLSAPHDSNNSSFSAKANAGWLGLSNADESSELKPVQEISEPLQQSLVYSILGDKLMTDLMAAETLLSFGEKGDGYYKAYNYTIWSVSVGSGMPPTESLSTSVVLVVIICGLGLPVLVFVLAGVGLSIWRIKYKKGELHDALLDNQENEAA